MNPISVINAASKQVTTHPTSVLRVRGYFRGSSADRWLQFFDANTAPADGTAPEFAPIPLPQTSPFFAEFEIGAYPFHLGCYVCVSSTESTKTLSADTMDITVELDEPEYPSGTSFVGDLTSGVTGLQVWNEANGATSRKKLYSLEVDGTNLTGGTQFIQIFATDTVNAGDKPIVSIPIAGGGTATVVNGVTVPSVRTGVAKLLFGADGTDVFSLDTDAKTKRVGCTVKISSTAPAYAACNGTATIKAEYK